MVLTSNKSQNHPGNKPSPEVTNNLTGLSKDDSPHLLKTHVQELLTGKNKSTPTAQSWTMAAPGQESSSSGEKPPSP